MESGEMLLQRESFADRIAAEAAESTALLSQAQIEACARILAPAITGEEGVIPAEPLHYSL